jgi:hypothetical protein
VFDGDVLQVYHFRLEALLPRFLPQLLRQFG